MSDQTQLDELIDLINQAAKFINEGKPAEGRAKLLEVLNRAEAGGQFDILPNVHLNLAGTGAAREIPKRRRRNSTRRKARQKNTASWKTRPSSPSSGSTSSTPRGATNRRGRRSSWP